MALNSITGYLTGGLINPVAPDYAGAATKAEKQRQALINQGLMDINSVFSGGTSTSFNPAQGSTFDPKGDYFRLGSKGFQPYNLQTLGGKLPGGGFDFTPGSKNGVLGALMTGSATDFLPQLFGGGPESPRSHLHKAFNKGQLFTGTPQTYKGFGPDFFNQAAQNYVDFAMPQFAQQYRDTQNSLNFGLANRGLSQSTQQKQAQSKLDVATGLGEQQIVDTARGTSQQLQKQVEDARNAAINNLYQTGDPSQALQQSIGAASQFAVPQTFSPLSNVFGNLANQYAINQIYNPQGLGTMNYLSNPYQFSQGMPNILGPTASY